MKINKKNPENFRIFIRLFTHLLSPESNEFCLSIEIKLYNCRI